MNDTNDIDLLRLHYNMALKREEEQKIRADEAVRQLALFEKHQEETCEEIVLKTTEDMRELTVAITLERDEARAKADRLRATMARVKAHMVMLHGEAQKQGTSASAAVCYALDQSIHILDSPPVEPVRAAPVAIEKVDGDVGYTVLVLVERDDWTQEDRIDLASYDLLLVPAKVKP